MDLIVYSSPCKTKDVIYFTLIYRNSLSSYWHKPRLSWSEHLALVRFLSLFLMRLLDSKWSSCVLLYFQALTVTIKQRNQHKRVDTVQAEWLWCLSECLSGQLTLSLSVTARVRSRVPFQQVTRTVRCSICCFWFVCTRITRNSTTFCV